MTDINLESLFAPLLRAKAIVLAVSGGPDSVAMMLMAAEWTRAIDTPNLFVATVDHGLRSESLQEASQVGLWASTLGLQHRILRWEGNKPKTRLQERARDARYELLCTYAAEVGADHIVTAHHSDDQAETILFRLLRGSGLKGLAGMAATTARGGLIHSRPLLGCTKAELVAFCRGRGQSFFEDPSNLNPAYARTKMRRLAALLSDYGLDRPGLLRLGTRAARADMALQARAEALIAVLRNTAEDSGFRADISMLRDESEEILGRILEIAIHVVRADAALLRLDRLEAATARLHAALAQHESFKTTLAGVTLHLDKGTYLYIRPESQRRRGRKQNV